MDATVYHGHCKVLQPHFVRGGEGSLLGQRVRGVNNRFRGDGSFNRLWRFSENPSLGNCKPEANNLLSLACKPRLCQNPTPCSQGRFIGVLFSSTCMESSSKWMNWKNLRIQISFCLRLFSLVFFWSLWFYDIRIWDGSRHSWVRKNQFTSFIITLLEQFTEPCMRASFFCHWQAWWSPDCTVKDTR